MLIYYLFLLIDNIFLFVTNSPFSYAFGVTLLASQLSRHPVPPLALNHSPCLSKPWKFQHEETFKLSYFFQFVHVNFLTIELILGCFTMSYNSVVSRMYETKFSVFRSEVFLTRKCINFKSESKVS